MLDPAVMLSPQSSSTRIKRSDYDTTSTLQRQYTQPVGQRITLFVRTNANCCLPGGVESLLKASKTPGPLLTTTSTGDSPTQSPVGADESSNASAAGNPFAFLSESSQTTPSTTASTQKKAPHQQVGQFFKKVAKQTQKNLERGMTNLAIKADQGKNPDWLVVGLYHGDTILGMTERTPLPMTDYERLKGASFQIPLVVPPPAEIDTPLVLKLWIKSGATLLKQTARDYLLGMCQTSTGRLQQLLQQQQKLISMPLQSNVIVDGQLHVLVYSDLKFPPIGGRGWSLTDPDLSGYSQDALYNLPLDQSYGYNHKGDWLLGTERATESTVVLPVATAFAKLAATACQKSLAHATSVSAALLANRHDTVEGYKAHVTVGVAYLLLQDPNRQATATHLSLHLQRPDHIFEVEVLSNTRVPVNTVHVPFSKNITQVMYPKVVVDNILPAILAQYPQRPAYLLGNLRFQLQTSTPKASGVTDSFAPVGPGIQAVSADEETWQGTVALESLVNRSGDSVMQIPVHNTSTGVQMGSLVVQLQVTLNATPTTQPQITSSQGGLVSLVGLDTLLESTATAPALDYEVTPDPANMEPTQQRRQQQLKTMGYFVTSPYVQQHVTNTRAKDAATLSERAEKYQLALSFNPQQELMPSHLDRSPKPFRPSSSRTTELLSGIPFNVHNASFALETIPSNPTTPSPGGSLFSNITCGAPADHAREFGALYPNGPSGGLRRLEAKRTELLQQLMDCQGALIQAVATYYVSARQANKTVYHIPARNQHIAQLRWKVYETTQNLHKTTWACSMRRASVFSQALGIALSSYLASLSDEARIAQGWAEVWVRHGYLLAYDGLLSAAGKELGMIEDASVGIAMLKNVSVKLVSSEDTTCPEGEMVMIPNSPYLKWVHLSASGVGSQTRYRLLVAVDPVYYGRRIPQALKDGEVSFFPLLIQVGVDIRQWGAHTQMNMKNQLSMRQELDTDGGEEDEDEAGVTDTDVLVQLNYEALRKMNAYAHAISPVTPVDGGIDASQISGSVHPILTNLHTHIMSSAGKMKYGIVDEAASVANKLGGGGVVFCKSGKDRTAMHVTYKQSQHMHRYRSGNAVTAGQVYDDATRLRVYGTRLPICEKNVGQAKFAFNTLQVRFMPDMLKPPIQTLAGFLKGGAVFKGGGIES